jgi:hypothetical protein
MDNSLNNIQIRFTVNLEEPMVDQPTQLKLTVQNLQKGTNLKNIAAANVVLNNNSGQLRT